MRPPAPLANPSAKSAGQPLSTLKWLLLKEEMKKLLHTSHGPSTQPTGPRMDPEHHVSGRGPLFDQTMVSPLEGLEDSNYLLGWCPCAGTKTMTQHIPQNIRQT